jgi:uncharacterized membrane protein
MERKPLVSAGILMGIGLGGFLDGITFHQILQIHNMLSAIRPKVTLVDAEVNMFWDGIFHLGTWIFTVVGLSKLWRAGGRPDVAWSGRTFFGALVLGWGLFNLVEGVIDHHILGLHHVVERLGVSVFDYAFLGSGAALILIGWGLIRSAAEDVTRHRPTTTAPA